MSRKIQQLFIHHGDLSRVAELLEEFVNKYSNNFKQCSKVHLHGVEQVLTNLITKKRVFKIYNDQEWTTIWEVVHHTAFADPFVAKFLSEKLKTQAIWIKLDEDYNIWSYQIFDSGKTIEEQFLPESYFLGEEESDDRFQYGSCFKFAERFNHSRKLPAFLASYDHLEQKTKAAPHFKSLVCSLPLD